MNINNAPSVVLFTIIDKISQKDLINFACASRRFYQHAHIRLTRCRYATVDLDGNLGEIMTAMLGLLCTIRSDPNIGQYVSAIKFLPDYIKPQTDIPDLSAKMQSCHFENLLTQCSWLDPTEREEWMAAVHAADRGAVFVILVNFLPKLEKLYLMGSLDTYNPWLRRLLDKQQKLAGGPLARVKMLHVEHDDTKDGVRLEEIGDLIHLPSLRLLSGFMIEAYDFHHDGYPVRPRAPDATAVSQIRSIRFLQSAINPLRLFEFVRPMEHLSGLRYEHGGATVGGPPDLDIDEYADEFESAAQEWLEERGLGVEIEGTDTMILSKAAFRA